MEILILFVIIFVAVCLSILLPLFVVIRNQNQKSRRERIELAKRHGFSVQSSEWNTLILNGVYRGYNITIKNYRAPWPYSRAFVFHIKLDIKNPENIGMQASWGLISKGHYGILPLLIQGRDDYYGRMTLYGSPKSYLLDFIYSSRVKRGIKKAIRRSDKLWRQVSLFMDDDQLIFEQLEKSLWASNQSYVQYMMDWLVDVAIEIDGATTVKKPK